MAHTDHDSSATLQARLFASLRPSGSRNSSASHPALRPADDNSAHPRDPFHPSAPSPTTRPQPSTSTQAFAPSLINLNEHQYPQDGKMSHPTASAADQTSNERTTNLLNLLKFGASTPTGGQSNSHQQTTARPGMGVPDTHSVHGRGISASDLVGSLMGKPTTPVSRENSKPLASANQQDTLLKLLNRSAPPQPPKVAVSQDGEGLGKKLSQDPAETSSNKQAPRSSEDDSRTSRKESPIRYFGTSEAQPTPFEPQDMPRLASPPTKEPLFTYVNPFEQLAASSPRNGRGSTPTGDRPKRKTKEPTPEPPTSKRKITPAGNEVLQSIESPGPTSSGDGRTQVEALLGIGAPTKDAETVAEALNEVGNKVDQEAEAALAKAEAKADKMEQLAAAKKEELELAKEATMDALAERVHEAASEVKHELDKKENEGLLEEAMPSPVAEAVRNIIDDAAQDNRAEAWESDDGDESQGQDTPEDDRIVHVYQFPLKPFVSIDIKKNDPPTLTVRFDAITHIARLRKEFDQIDRTLATATNEVIVYASPKSGGLRIIRQDDGLAKHMFSNARDRIFSVSISTVPRSDQGAQSVLATGVSGTVYWATVMKPDANIFDESLDTAGFAFPPTSSQSQNTSGGQLKTRAKRSSRRPHIFAIGRGKSIIIISAHHAARSDHLLGGEKIGEGNVLDMDSYLEDRNLRITTGKAGKDFVFSVDDSVILTLDKSGRLKLWDIVDLLDCATDAAAKVGPIELKAPTLTLATATSSEKLSPTSVLFVDKQRSYVKGIAQRYVLVGLKQNHVLQLWDLCLLKAVQELNFPHDQEADAICSVAFHPPSGIIVLGHPTRNSIYFIHLSAPKYNLSTMTQAKFVQKLAKKDPALPRPEATAIMSGLREYSFDSIGHIRSIDLVGVEESRRTGEDESDPPLFELYVMHSKGVTSLSINKADLGWSEDSKVRHPIDAEREKHIVVRDLRENSQPAISEHSSVNGDGVTPKAAATSRATAKDPSKLAQTGRRNPSETKKEGKAVTEAPPTAERVNAASRAASPSNADSKAEKKKKKKRDVATTSTTNAKDAAAKNDELMEGAAQVDDSHGQSAQLAQGLASSTAQEASENVRSTGQMPNGESINIGISGEFLDKELKKIEHAVSAEFKRVFAHELETLYRRIDEDKRVQSAAGAAKQDAMLRLVSATLGENVEKSLSRIIQTNIQQAVIPAVGNLAEKTIDRTLSDTISQQLHHVIPPLLKLAIPEAVSRGVQNPDVLRPLSDQLSSKLTSHVEREFSSALHDTIMPAFHNLAVNVAQKAANETEIRVQEKIKQADSQHRKDSAKIDQLTELVQGLSETVHTMAAAQRDFQQEILNLQQHVIQDRHASSGGTGSMHGASGASRESTTVFKAPEQEALESVASLVDTNRYEEATIQWLQSEFQNYIFDGYLAQIDPRYLRNLSPLLNLSVSAAVTSNMETSLAERLTWLESVFATINPGVGASFVDGSPDVDLSQDPDLRDVGARIMEVLRERLESGFMYITMNKPNEPNLRRIPPLAHQTREFLSRTPRNPPPLLHTLKFAPPMRLCLAHHIVVIVVLASCTDEEGSAHQRGGAGTDLLDLGDGVWEWGGIDEDGLIKAGGSVSVSLQSLLWLPSQEASLTHTASARLILHLFTAVLPRLNNRKALPFAFHSPFIDMSLFGTSTTTLTNNNSNPNPLGTGTSSIFSNLNNNNNQQQNQQTPAPNPFLNLGKSTNTFGSSTTQKPSPFGSLLSQQPTNQNTGLFGSSQPPQQQQQQQQQTSSLFGNTQNASNAQQGSSLFGKPLGQGQSSLFGGQQQAQQPQSSLFSSAQQHQQQAPQTQSVFGQSQPSIFKQTEVWPRPRSVADQIEVAFQKWNPESSVSSFQTYIYNFTDPSFVPFCQPGAADNPAKWEEAMSKKPHPGAVPIIVKGFQLLGKRMVFQNQLLSTLQGRLHEINNGLNEMLRRHDLVISTRAAEARKRHLRLNLQCTRLATKVQVLRNRGYAMDSTEEELKKKLLALENKVMDPALNGRAEEIWARMVSVRERGRQLQRELEKAGRTLPKEQEQSIDEDTMKKASKILEDYSSQLAHLAKELEGLQKDLKKWQDGKSGAANLSGHA
ncbi:MAG: hypothetical protein Q9228_002175 [Teloschistes exilis]